AEPETGRQHQIRVHLAHVGYPIVGDKLYAHGTSPFLASLRQELTDELRALLLLERHALHAQRITFEHPENGRAVSIEAEFPADLAAFARERARVDAAGTGC